MKKLFTRFQSYSSKQEYMHKNILAAAMVLCLLSSSAIVSAQVAIATNPGTSSNVPVGTSNYHVSEVIYTTAELGSNFTTAPDAITSISFTCTTAATANPTVGAAAGTYKIYFKDVPSTTTTLAAGVYTTAGYTLVYSGSMDLSTTGVKQLTLTTTYVRASGTNLQMLVERTDNLLHTGNIFATSSGSEVSSAVVSVRRYSSTLPPVSGTTSLGTTSAFRPAIVLASAIPATPPSCATALTPASGTATLLCPSATIAPSSAAFSWTAPASGPVPTGYKFYLAAAPATPALLGSVASPGVSVNNLLPNTTYNWYVVPTINGGGVDAVGCAVPLTFTTGAEPSCVVNNSCATATIIGTSGNVGTVNSTTTGASISQIGEVCASFTGNPDDDVWFRFTTDGDGGDVAVALTGAATTLDAVMHVYSGTCGTLVNIGCADATASGLAETATLTGLAANTTYYVRVYGYGSFSATTPTSGAFTLTTSGTGVAGTIIPIELQSFTGEVQGSVNLLNWETATEINVKSHIVERSVDGQRWTQVGAVTAKGNSLKSVKYTLEDRNPLVRAYYRLRSVDFDGKENVSSTIALTRKGKNFGITSVYPSPSVSNVIVQFNATSEEKVTVRIMDMTGRLVMQQVTDVVKDINELPITLTGFQSGVYSVTVSNSTGVSAPVRFVKL
jgi:hypothetical protein